MQIEIVSYSDWMHDQVSKLFMSEYKVDEKAFKKLLLDFYEHPYQKDKCIRIAALDGKKVVGFQSFFYWPYTRGGAVYNAYQSGNSLVHPDYRGNGIFQKMLDHLDVNNQNYSIDLLVGFPIAVSKNSLLRNGWKNIFDLSWSIRLISVWPLLMPLRYDPLAREFPATEEHFADADREHFSLQDTLEFSNWRKNYSNKKDHFTFVYKENENKIRFSLKVELRKKFIKQLIIGGVASTSQDALLLERGIKTLLKKVRHSRTINFVSIAYNLQNNTALKDVLRLCGFKLHSRSIFFMIKPFSEIPGLLEARNWKIYRGDIDTW